MGNRGTCKISSLEIFYVIVLCNLARIIPKIVFYVCNVFVDDGNYGHNVPPCPIHAQGSIWSFFEAHHSSAPKAGHIKAGRSDVKFWGSLTSLGWCLGCFLGRTFCTSRQGVAGSWLGIARKCLGWLVLLWLGLGVARPPFMQVSPELRHGLGIGSWQSNKTRQETSISFQKLAWQLLGTGKGGFCTLRVSEARNHYKIQTRCIFQQIILWISTLGVADICRKPCDLRSATQIPPNLPGAKKNYRKIL